MKKGAKTLGRLVLGSLRTPKGEDCPRIAVIEALSGTNLNTPANDHLAAQACANRAASGAERGSQGGLRLRCGLLGFLSEKCGGNGKGRKNSKRGGRSIRNKSDV